MLHEVLGVFRGYSHRLLGWAHVAKLFVICLLDALARIARTWLHVGRCPPVFRCHSLVDNSSDSSCVFGTTCVHA